MKKMLINAIQEEETRIAIIDDDNNHLSDFYVENIDKEQKKSNIYKGKISRIEPSLNAIFCKIWGRKKWFSAI